MKKILLSMAFLSFSLLGFAQITVSTDTVEYGGFPRPTSDSHKAGIISNTSTTDSVTISWVKLSESMKNGWSGSSICDWTDCYTFDGTTYTKKLGPGKQGNFYVGMSTTSTAETGCSYATIRFTESGTATPKTITYKYCAWPLAVKNYENTNIVTIYPNPASTYVDITLNDKSITSINVLNVIGKRIARFAVDANKSNSMRVPLDNVSDGIYMLQFADANGKLLGVRRVTKN